MNTYNIFIDESGTATPKNYAVSPFFSLAGVMINDLEGEKLQEDLDQLKIKYFGKKSYVLHATDLKYHLRKTGKKLKDFSSDLNIVLNKCNFSLLYVVIDNEKAFNKGWDSIHIYKSAYSILLANMLKFLVAKNRRGRIVAEASNYQQDSLLYYSFFKLMRQGVNTVSISPNEAKKHLTSLNFVTKLNHDSEEQLSDLFGFFGRMKVEIDRGNRTVDSLDPFETVIYHQANKKLFRGNNAQIKRKKELYTAINSFKLIP